jgi:NADH-quinone oxidoreductase subunit F
MVPGAFDVSGRRKPVATDEVYDIPCDTVMTAIGERVDSDFLKDFGIQVRRDGTVDADMFTLETSVPMVYAGGDLVTGPSTAVEAMAHGKRAAAVLDLILSGEDRFSRLFKKFDYENKVPVEPQGGRKQNGKHLSLAARKNNFKEVSLGLTPAQARLECFRCLRCDVKE